MNRIPVYYFGRDYAEKHGQLKAWEESRKVDKQFADEVQKRAGETQSGREIEELADDLIRVYGLERAMTMLARTVHFRTRDAQVSDYIRENADNLPPDWSEWPDELDPCVCCELPDHALNALYLKTVAGLNAQVVYEDEENEDEQEREL